MSAPASSSFPSGFGAIDGVRSRDLTSTEKLITLAIFLYWLVYENIIFFYPMEFGGTFLFILTNGLKLFLPICLLFFTGMPSPRIAGRGAVGLYLFFFAAFLLWGLVPTLVSGDPIAWFKLLPRFVFFVSIVAFFSRSPAAFSLYSKCIVGYVLSALLQYILLYLTGSYDRAGMVYLPGLFYLAGPFGLLGNVTSMLYFPVYPYAIFRFCGFWNEPSNASASAFAAFFLARYLVLTGESTFWRVASYGCLVAGLLALANAGYFALGSALLIGVIFGAGRFTAQRAIQLALLLPVAAVLLVIVVFGRSYVVENYPDNPWARAITGVRETQLADYDPTAGRGDLLVSTAKKTESTIIGLGIQEVGSEGIDASATAPLYWVLLTGIPGLLLLLGREAVLLVSGSLLLRRLPAMLPIVQALVAVMGQHLVYGTWMNPNYLVLAAMVLVCSHKSTQRLLATSHRSHRHG